MKRISLKPCAFRLRAAASRMHVVGRRRHRDRAGVLPIGIALGHVLQHRRDQRVLQAARHQVRGVARRRSYACRSTMWYPFFSVPPVGTITVGLAGLHRVAGFFPRQLVDEHRVGRLRRRLARRRRIHRRLDVRPRGACAAAPPRPPLGRRVRRRPPPPAAAAATGGSRAVLHPLDLRHREIELDLQQLLADLGRGLALVVAADAVVRIVVAGQAIACECARR